MLVIFAATGTDGGTGIFVSNGIHFKWIKTSTEHGDYLNNTGPAFNGGKPVQEWSSLTPVADVAAFGTPANAETARVLGIPFP